MLRALCLLGVILIGGCLESGTPGAPDPVPSPPATAPPASPSPPTDPPAPPAPETLTPRTLARGSFSGIHEDTRLALRDRASWSALWGQHGNASEAPAFDAENETVIAVVVHGPTGCAGIRLGAIVFNGTATTVEVIHETAPENIQCFVAFEDVYEFAAIARREGGVTFTDRQEPAPKPTSPEPATPAPATGDFTFRTIARGGTSGVNDLRRDIITNESAWRAFWDEHGSTQMPPPSLPSVDFDHEWIFIATAGDRPNTCWNLEIERMHITDESVEVYVRTGAVAQMCGQMITQPFHYVTYPITGKTVEIFETTS